MKSSLRFGRKLKIEMLEVRQVLSASTSSDLVTPNLIVVPDATTSSIRGFTPAQIKAAYSFNGITFTSGSTTVAGTGAGETIAIVDAYNDPNIAADLATFDSQFGLSAPASFKVVNESGGASLPSNNRGWASEIALDVEWAHAIAPGANILLVEASSANTTDLDKAEDYARNASGVVVVSNSWGGSEYNGEASEDVHFTAPTGKGVSFTVAAGDEGGGAEYPSSSPDVISVGGSTLRLTSTNTYSSESVWSDGGGGASRYEGLPSYQTGLGITDRGTPDVSYDANPNSGVAVYDSYGSGGWAEFGGTSAGAPQWAALVAIADQGRAAAGKGSLANVQDVLYTLSKSDFHDITSGSNGFSAGTGYDLASGLGSPIASSVIRDLVAYGGSTKFTVASPVTTTGHRGFGFGGFGGFSGFGFGGFFFGFDVPAGGQVAAASGSAATTEGSGDAIGSGQGNAAIAAIDSFFIADDNGAASAPQTLSQSSNTNNLASDSDSGLQPISLDQTGGDGTACSVAASVDAGLGVSLSSDLVDAHFATLDS
ncbi:MAG TPA: S53 family peptidase [Pirellulales bacterium]|jgi:subtilase family serine protease|nr:S53 family peptidase [Pirellulales bacterium]